MNKLWIVAKNEFLRYFMSPLAYVYLISFLLLNGSFAIYFGHFFDIGQASLLPMFSFQPWLYLLFVPGISMRLWAEEFRTKTVLQIITMPVSIPTLVWGKFFAAWAFCGLALLLTFPFWITVNLLGNPDNWVIFNSYLGSFILAGCMLSISQTMSALTKNQVIALVLAVFANLLFFLSGLEYVLEVFRTFLPPAAIDTIASFSFLSHFETISYGLLELRDIVFFNSLILLFNFTAILIVSFKTSGTTAWFKSTRKFFYILVFFFLLLSFSGLNMLANASLRNIKADFTQEKFFTLTSSTENILKNLPNRVTAKLYFSPIIAERNPQSRILFDKIRLKLEQYARLSDGRLSIRILNPEPLSNVEDEAIANGLQPFPLVDSNINTYFGLVLTDEADNKQVIKLFPPERQNFLEQDLTTAVYLLNAPKKNLGILTSLPMFEEIVANVATPKWEIIRQLEQFYNIRRISGSDNNLQGLDALMIVHPRNLDKQTIEKIKQYSATGGKVIAFFDVAAESTRIFAPSTDVLKASNFGDLTEFWGIKFIDKAVVADLNNSTLIDASVDYQNNPEFTQDLIQFYIPKASFNALSPITKLLQKMLVTSASIFVPKSDAAVDITPLISLSGESQLFSADVVYNNVHPSYMLRNFKPDNKLKLFAAYLKSRNPQTPFEVIVVGDSDLLYDNFWTGHNTILGNSYAIPTLDNANFVLNALDYLQQDDALIALRGKNLLSRPFVSIEDIRRRALQEFKIKEVEIFSNIEKARLGLEEITAKRIFEERENFSVDEMALIAKTRQQLNQERLNLLQIRNQLNKESDSIQNKIKFFNIYAIPLLIIAGFFLLKLRRIKLVPLQALKLDTQIAAIGAASLLIFGIGIGASLTSQSSYQQPKSQPLFADMEKEINKITEINLQNHQETLRLKKQDKLWQIEGQPHILVNQKRISHLLTTLLTGKLLEQKTTKLSNFENFGLSPLESDGSQMTRLGLNSAEKTLYQLEIGKYDIDLGRGAKGAYVKFPNSYQVWLSDLDVISLNPDWHDWSFSHLWNLQFGRLIKINDDKNPNFLADIAKVLLNTPFEEAQPSLSDAEHELTLTIQSEGNNEVILHFYKDGKNIFVKYEFSHLASEHILQLFAQYATNVFYQIPTTNWEKLNYVITEYRTTK